MVNDGEKNILICMKDKLRINFVDFWPNLEKRDNYFYHLLSTEFDVVIDEEEPEILFHSVDYLNEQNHKKYDNGRTVKVFYTGENQRPDFDETHFAFSFDYSDDSRNYRLPLWMLHLNWFDVPHNEDRDQSYLHSLDDFLDKKIDIDKIRETKKEFCTFISSVAKGRRVDFVPKLHNKYKPIACAGGLFNNVRGKLNGRGDQRWKIEFLNLFKFNISFEHTRQPGYVTEKIIHPMFANTIPIYWGSRRVEEEFNPKSFINGNKYHNDEELIDVIAKIDSDEDLYISMLNEPWFNNNEIPEYAKPENVMKFFKEKVLA